MLQALIGPVTGLLDKFIPDADKRQNLLIRQPPCLKDMLKVALAQIEVLKEDAKGNWFQSYGDP